MGSSQRVPLLRSAPARSAGARARARVRQRAAADGQVNWNRGCSQVEAATWQGLEAAARQGAPTGRGSGKVAQAKQKAWHLCSARALPAFAF